MKEQIEKARKRLEEADVAKCFEELDKVESEMPSELKTVYNTHKQKFMQGKQDWDFSQQMYVFLKVLEGKNKIDIKSIDEEKITLDIDGEIREIKSLLKNFQNISQLQGNKNIQYVNKIYNIEHINEANFGLLSGKQAFNETITRSLIEAISPYTEDAQTLIGYMQRNNIADWASQERYAKKAKEILAYSYVGVLGMQLSHLMGIGKDNRRRAEEKIIPYIEKCLFIARYSLDLISFAFISKLWDLQQKAPQAVDDHQRAVLQKFFERQFEPDFAEQMNLLKTLYPLFKEADLPFVEMKDFSPHFEETSSLYQSIGKLQKLKKMTDEKYTFVEAAEAETELANMMTHFAFLANYNMASIKRVGYKYLRNTDPHFIHNFIELGFDQKANPDVERHLYTPDDIATDTVLIYQGENYSQFINLFPFVLDYNALTFEQGPKIYFYQNLKFQDNNIIEYALLKDDTVKAIEFADIQSQTPDFNELVGKPEKLKTLNIDHAILQFREAKAKLTAAAVDSDKDFDALF